MKGKISVFIMSITCLMTIFTSCESDETDFEPNNKIELLKAKSKEFAKKYDVDVTLNDDSIAKYADQMTVEGMEEDYKAFAEMKKVCKISAQKRCPLSRQSCFQKEIF